MIPPDKDEFLFFLFTAALSTFIWLPIIYQVMYSRNSSGLDGRLIQTLVPKNPILPCGFEKIEERDFRNPCGSHAFIRL